MPIDEVKKVCFVGTGTMGCLNSLICAVGGYEAVLYDVSEEALKQAPRRQKMMGALAIEQGVLTQELVDQAMSRITVTSDPGQAAENADLLSESVNEKLELKRKIHKQFDELCPPKTIMTTNTSSLLVSQIEDCVLRGDKFAALHFHGMRPLVDIVGGPRTSPETIEILKRFSRSIGQTPMVLKKEKDGYLHNTMLISLLKSAALLVIDGYANVEDVDRSWMIVHQSELGPFGWMDAVGLNVCLEVCEEQAKLRDREEFKRMIDYLRPYVDRGELGVKTGKGFYTYPNPVFQKPGFLTGLED